MLEPIRDILETKRLILASQSPCRREIINILNLKFETIVSGYPEDLNPSDFPDTEAFVIQTAYNKGSKVRDSLSDPYEMIVSADSVIRCEGEIFGKPKDHDDARRMLQKMSNNVHEVFTGCCLFWADGQEEKFVYVSHVKFSDITKCIDGYLQTREYVGKSGAYAIQGLGGTFAENITGDYYNIVGLPLNLFCKHVVKHYTS